MRFVSACKSIFLSGGCQTCVRSFSQSSSVPPFFSFVISCQPDTGRTEFHCNPNVSLCVRGKCTMTFTMCYFLFCLYDCNNSCCINMSIYKACCRVYIMNFKCERVYFTFFSNSTALASLVSTLVWSTMLSVERTEERKREREIEKRLVNTIKVSDNVPVHVAVKTSHPSVWHMLCAHTFTNRCIHTEKASEVSPFFPLITVLESQDPWDDCESISL